MYIYIHTHIYIYTYVCKFVGTNNEYSNQVKRSPASYQVQLFRRINGPQRKGATVSCSVSVYWQKCIG